MRKIRYLDKLVDELAKGKAIEKIVRAVGMMVVMIDAIAESGGARRPAPADRQHGHAAANGAAARAGGAAPGAD